MSQVATYRDKRPVVAKPYAPGGCPIINTGKQKCGETVGLDIIMDFHKLYQEKMNEIDVSAGGDSLQEKVDLQEQWIEDLTAQNKLLAKVIEELESETIGRVQQMEDKLNNAVKSFGKDESRALEEKNKKIEALEDKLKALPAPDEDLKKISEESNRLKQAELSEKEIKSHYMPETHLEESKPQNEKPSGTLKSPVFSVELPLNEKKQENIEEIVEPVIPSDVAPPTSISMKSESQEKLIVECSTGLSKASSKSVHLIVDDGENGSLVVEPQKDPTITPDFPEKPSIEAVPVVGTQDSLELQGKSQHVLEEQLPAKENDVCFCEIKDYWQQLDKLKEENKMLREGNELQLLKDEVEEKMRRILELNEENRTLNDMINMLRTNQTTKKQKEHPGASEPMSSDSDYSTGGCEPIRAPVKPPSPKRRIVCREKCGYQYRDMPDPTQMSRKCCICGEEPEKGNESPPCIDVYKREDKGKFISDSSSTVCNEELCPFLKTQFTPYDNQERARGGNDSNIQCPAEKFPFQSNGLMDECQDTTCPNKDNPPINQIDANAINCGTNDIALTCGNSICQTEICEEFPGDLIPPNLECTKDSCLNTTCDDLEQVIGVSDFAVECSDETCPNKDYYPPTISVSGGVNFPIVCDETSCQVIECYTRSGDEIPPDQSHISQEFVEEGPQYDSQALTTKPFTPQPGQGLSSHPSTHIDCTCVNMGTYPVQVDPNCPCMRNTGILPIQYAFAPEGVPKIPSTCICGVPSECLRNVPPDVKQIDQQASSSAYPPTEEFDVMDEKPFTAIKEMPSTEVTEMPSTVEGESPTTVEGETPAIAVEDETASPVTVEKPSEVNSVLGPAAVQGTYVPVNEQPSEAVNDKPSIHIDEKPSVALSAQPSEAMSAKPTAEMTEKPSAAIPEKPSQVESFVSPTAVENLADQISGKPSAVVNDRPSVHMSEKPSAVATEKPSQSVGEPVSATTDKFCNDSTCDKRIPDSESTEPAVPIEIPKPIPPPAGGDDRTIIRCICKSKFCKLIPDPSNPGQRLCVDSSNTNVDRRNSCCVCQPSCPNNDLASSDQPAEVCPPCEGTPNDIPKAMLESQYPKETTILTVNQLYLMPKTPESLSKEQEYAGLSRKDNTGRRTGYIAPRKTSSQYEIQDDGNEELIGNEDIKNADLKLLIADLKSKLLDAEDKIEELKIGKNYIDKDNDTALIMKYSEEINQMKKSLRWTKKEREEYEFLKQRVKLLEQGKGDTDNITSNLQTADEKIVIKKQLKKLTKKNKCYEEVVQFFKEEMSVMSDELLTLQEVLNVTNVSSQDENNKLIGAILQLRRINDRLVEHLCAIEKKVLLDDQINQINETRINELQEIISNKNNDLNQHDYIIQDMRRKLNSATRQNADLKNTIKNLTDTVVEIQEGIKSVERDQMKNLNDVSVVESKVCLANGDLESIKTCMEQKNSRIVELEGQLKSQEIELILATKELGMLKEKKSVSKEMINSLKQQLSIAEKKNEEISGDYQLVVRKLQDYSSLEHMKNYELNHYKSLVEEMKMSLAQLNNGLDKCEATNIHFYEELRNSDNLHGRLQYRKNNLPIVFEELKKSMADLKKRISDADVKGGLIEEELLKVKESHMSQIPEEITDTQKELQEKIISSIEEQSRLNQQVEEQKDEIQRLNRELEKEKEDVCCCKRSVSELKNEKTSSNAQMEISHLKCELNKSIHRQKLLNEENDQIHTQMINLRKKLTVLEQAYDVLKQENEDYKLQLKRTIREKEYLTHKYHDLTKTMEQMRSTHDQLEKQCRTMMERMSEERSWTKTPMQQPFSQRRYGTMANLNRRTASPPKTRKLERHTADARYRSSSPLRDLSAYMTDVYLSEDTNSHRSNMVRNISYDSNSSPYTSRSPSPRSNSIHGEDDFDEMNLNDWFSPNYKESNTDADEGEEDTFINKVHLMTAQVQEANKRWQKKMNKEHLSKSRASYNK